MHLLDEWKNEWSIPEMLVEARAGVVLWFFSHSLWISQETSQLTRSED
jgi:hypothetical protein